MYTKRIQLLSDRITKPLLRNAWKNSVRSGMRKQPLVDLHDYLDIHKNQVELIDRIYNDISQGTYRPHSFEVVTLEKKLGISRRIVVPSAVDAIALQAVVNHIESQLLTEKPSESAFYSRSHHPSTVQDIDNSFSYAWWQLWPEFQQRILNFAKAYKFIVMTDVANFFDSIPLNRLRNHIVSIGKFPEEVIDFLFLLIESFVWRPQYIPHSGIGLPQINFDAPRLLSFVYLYEADIFLNEKCDGDFCRWMDDINFGVNTEEEGKDILGSLDNLLASQGIRINIEKSSIISGEIAQHHLWFEDNRKLTTLIRLLDNSVNKEKTVERIFPVAYLSFKAFYRKKRIGQWPQVLKRYLTLFGNLNSPALCRWMPKILQDYPKVRENAFSYYRKIGYSPKRFRDIEDFIRESRSFDDVTLFSICKLITEWQIPSKSMYRKRALDIGFIVSSFTHLKVSGFTGGLWLISKYGSANHIEKYLNNNRTWIQSEWCARQAAAVTPLLSDPVKGNIRESIRSSGRLEALGVLANIENIQNQLRPDNQIKMYLTHISSFNLSKAILAYTILKGKITEESRAGLINSLMTVVTDPIYREMLKLEHVN